MSSRLSPAQNKLVPPSQRLPWYIKFPVSYALAGAFLLGALVVVGIERTGLAAWFLDAPAGVEVPLVTASFPICSGGKRVTCVVDGDTFWLEGTKYRIADFNTPETGSPACSSEAELGRRATLRLAELLNAGPFGIAPYERDTDQYGRSLRIITRDGHSIADTMIAEGLAHAWNGRRESWC